MSTPTAEFFHRLSEVSHQPSLRKAKGTIRFDLLDSQTTQHWHVAVLHGDIAVSRENTAADAVLRASREVFDKVVQGECNVMAAALRGTIHYEGDPQFAVLFRRLFGAALVAPARPDETPEPAEPRQRPRRGRRAL